MTTTSTQTAWLALTMDAAARRQWIAARPDRTHADWYNLPADVRAGWIKYFTDPR